jgi:hypothetical protein
MPTATATLPPPSKAHATCPWCTRHLDSIVDLLDHVDAEHLVGPT